MKHDVYQCPIVSKEEIAPGITDITVRCRPIAEAARPGQFLHIQCGDDIAMPLRRPISICDASGELVRFIFEKKGRGTQNLDTFGTGDELNILGPLGNPFTVDKITFAKPAVIGGGIGAYPLLFLSKQLEKPAVYLGFRSKEQVTLEEDFRMASSDVQIATDDGSYGYHGFAITLLENSIERGDAPDIIYSCGPKPMLRAVQALAEKYRIRCQLSLEERMGCGIGACLTCTCETTSKGMWKYKRVCKNGPVFWADEVVLS